MRTIDRFHESGIARPGEYWGGILGLSKYFIGAHGEVVSFHGRKPKKLSPIKMGNYKGFQLSLDNGKTKKYYLHRLVAELIYGPCPEDKECCHSDGNKDNNLFNNLRWDTKEANEADKGDRFGSRSPAKKITIELVRKIRLLGTEDLSQKKIATMVGVSQATVQRILSGTSWRTEI